MHKFLATIIILTLCQSCNKHNQSNDQAIDIPEQQDETPEVLNDDKNDISLSSYKRSGDDIIKKLFNEALEKDPRLKSQTLRIANIDEFKNDSLEAYQDYSINNEAYWRTLEQYTYQIGDSILKNDAMVMIKTMQLTYEKRIADHTSLSALIKERESDLADKEIILKILVTEPMMANYMRNELPELQKLQSILDRYDSLLEDMKPYTSIQK